MIEIERVYDRSAANGKRFLVERLWPRGIRKERLECDDWLKEVAPSPELREWFSHDPSSNEFKRRYVQRNWISTRNPGNRSRCVAAGTAILLYSSRDTEHNNALALKFYLDAKLGHQSKAA